MEKRDTKPVRMAGGKVEKLRLIAEMLSDKAGKEITMGELLEKSIEPLIKLHFKEAVEHGMARMKAMLPAK